MKVNDYVRLKEGIIAKIKKDLGKDEGYYNMKHYVIDRLTNRNETIIYKENIIKSSPNIIELLKKHDLVIVEYFSLAYGKRVARLCEVSCKDKEFMTLNGAYCGFTLKNNEFDDEDKGMQPVIKSIVTKEQFERCEYKV